MTEQQTKKMLGSKIVLTLRDDEIDAKIFPLVWQEIRQFEKRFSRFLASSELSQINRKAGQAVEISPEFKDLILACQKMAKATQNLFNPFILPALQSAGYIGSWPNIDIKKNNLDFSNRRICNIDNIKLMKNTILIPSNCALDFGGIGKGYLLDKIAAIIERHKIKNYWLSFGGDLIFAGHDEQKIGWQVGIADAKNPKKEIDILETFGQKMAVATSGVVKRKGEGWHHLIDPGTGRPAESNILTATVVAQSATLTDVLAKSLVILGLTKTTKFIKTQKIIFAIIQTKTGEVIRIGGKK